MPEISRLRSVFHLLREIAEPTHKLSPAERIRFEDERIDFNKRRILAVLPVFAAIQIVMVILYLPRVDGPADGFRQGIWYVHATSLPMILTLVGAAWYATRKSRPFSWLGDVAVVLSIIIGMCLSLTTHRLVPTNNSFTVALFGCALILRPTMVGTLIGYGGAIFAFGALLRPIQPDVELRIPFVATGTSAVILALVLSRVLHAASVRELVQRLTIERQKDELRDWNAELERRVAEQVEIALARERETRALDAQLRMKVRARSQELVRAILDVTPEDDILAQGSRFEQRFEIERSLGSGAMGDVYAGRDLETGQSVAIKLMRRWDGMLPSDVSRFAMEAAATAAVVHSAIVRTFHVDVTATGRLYLVMELVSGQTLASALHHGRFDAMQVARFGAVAAEALAAAHGAGVIHRDIKPSNMMLTDTTPGLRILDFGVSKLALPGNVHQTVAGEIMGTPQYMAPEQILGTGSVTGACDVYALGLVLHEMSTGEPTFVAKNMGELLRAQLTVEPPSLRSRLGEDVPVELSELVGQCLEKEADLRPTAEVLATALRVLADSLHAPPLEKIGAPRLMHPGGESEEASAPTLPINH